MTIRDMERVRRDILQIEHKIFIRTRINVVIIIYSNILTYIGVR